MNTKRHAHDPTTRERRLQDAALMARRVDGDRLLLADATLLAALDGSRPLTAGERAALQGSPLTQRRLRHLALARRAAASAASAATGAATAAVADAHAGSIDIGPDWRGSRGMLRAAASAGPAAPVSDDGWWTLHLLGGGDAWRLVLQLAPAAPFAPGLLAVRAPVRVRDGDGKVLLEGRLDADGECEAAWPFADAPAAHLQARGARFSVEPC